MSHTLNLGLKNIHGCYTFHNPWLLSSWIRLDMLTRCSRTKRCFRPREWYKQSQYYSLTKDCPIRQPNNHCVQPFSFDQRLFWSHWKLVFLHKLNNVCGHFFFFLCGSVSGKISKAHLKEGAYSNPSKTHIVSTRRQWLNTVRVPVLKLHLMGMSRSSGHFPSWARVASLVSMCAHVPLMMR